MPGVPELTRGLVQSEARTLCCNQGPHSAVAKSAPGGTASTKAVSLRHISAAMDCRVLSSKLAKASSRHTAAGLPWKARLANASTCGNANEFTKD